MVELTNIRTGGEIEAPSAPAPGPSLSLADQIKADATRIERATDAAGRVIGVKKLNFLDTHRITRLLGSDAANSTALEQALMTASVVEIDGQPLSKPGTLLQLEATMSRLDFHGLSAAIKAMSRFTPVMAADDDEAAAIKN
jgi:hypothetical protein